MRLGYELHLFHVIVTSILCSLMAGDSGILFETLSPSPSDDDNDEEYLPESDSSRHQVAVLLR